MGSGEAASLALPCSRRRRIGKGHAGLAAKPDARGNGNVRRDEINA
jgi:hypothetical protein